MTFSEVSLVICDCDAGQYLNWRDIKFPYFPKLPSIEKSRKGHWIFINPKKTTMYVYNLLPSANESTMSGQEVRGNLEREDPNADATTTTDPFNTFLHPFVLTTLNILAQILTVLLLENKHAGDPKWECKHSYVFAFYSSLKICWFTEAIFGVPVAIFLFFYDRAHPNINNDKRRYWIALTVSFFTWAAAGVGVLLVHTSNKRCGA